MLPPHYLEQAVGAFDGGTVLVLALLLPRCEFVGHTRGLREIPDCVRGVVDQFGGRLRDVFETRNDGLREAFRARVVTRLRPSALCQPLWALMSLSEKVVTTFQTAPPCPHRQRSPSPRWRRALRRSKLVVVLVDELGRIEGIVVVIEGVRLDVERRRQEMWGDIVEKLEELEEQHPRSSARCGRRESMRVEVITCMRLSAETAAVISSQRCRPTPVDSRAMLEICGSAWEGAYLPG